jgi:hypothetical protein
MSRARPFRSLIMMNMLAAWIGVAVFIAAVIAPAAFAVLPTRALAGALIGQALPVLFISGILVAAVVIVLHATADRAAALGGLVLLAANASALLIENRLHALLVSLGAPIDSIPITDARRVEFGRLHGMSVLLMAVGLLGASVALVMLMRRVSVDPVPLPPALS